MSEITKKGDFLTFQFRGGNDVHALILEDIRAANTALIEIGFLPEDIDQSRITLEVPRDPSHGDLASNNAIVLAQAARKDPREVAKKHAEILRHNPRYRDVQIAGAGFENLTLDPSVWTEALRAAISAGAYYGRSDFGAGEKVNIEFVSANPTGPMHVGHGRGAVFGDALANLLASVGFAVTREYYINDAGTQVDALARSAFLRYREALGEDIGEIPEGLYPGDYLKPVGQQLVQLYETRLLEKSESETLRIVRQVALESMLISILTDLEKLNITFDSFFSEKSLLEGAVRFSAPDQLPTFHFAQQTYDLSPTGPDGIFAYLAKQKWKSSAIQGRESKTISFSKDIGELDYLRKTLEKLTEQGLIYRGRLPPPKGGAAEDWEDREQLLFRSTAFGDDVDRPLMKSNGSYTYFASDIAYHKSKFERGFHQMIDVWGADHGGYVKRMKAAVSAVSGGKADLDIKLVQLVRLLRAGEPVKMSKRAGDFVTLREVVDEVGRDAVRFMMLFRKNDATLDFDLAKVIEQSRDNPVFYVQYGHARGHSVFRNAREAFPELPEANEARATLLASVTLQRLEDSAELALMRKIALFPRLVEAAAAAHEPHRVAFYLYELASEFHAFWTRGKDSPHLRFIIQNDRELTLARLALVQGVVTVLACGLKLLGVEAPNEMR